MTVVLAAVVLVSSAVTTWGFVHLGKTIRRHRTELDQLQKFRAYSLLLMDLDRDKARIGKLLEEVGMENPWAEQQERSG